ncbi:MAG: cytochrome c1 [Magnetococcus sp. WYHC-3]
MQIMRMMKSVALVAALIPGVALASGGGAPLPKEDWGHHGILGRFDPAQLQRGAQVAAEVCLACHNIKYIKWEHLAKIGMSEDRIVQMAETAGHTKKDAMLSAMDATAAKDSFGVVPPDLSLMTKARKGYENYVYGILNGYLDDEQSSKISELAGAGELSGEKLEEAAKILGMDPHHPEAVNAAVQRIAGGSNFNHYFAGHFLAMPKPLSADQVTYADGTQATLPQMAKDVTTFLAWASEPTQEDRKKTGIWVMLYLVVLTPMLYAVKKRIWAKIH